MPESADPDYPIKAGRRQRVMAAEALLLDGMPAPEVSATLAKRFEVSERSVQRDMVYLRKRLRKLEEPRLRRLRVESAMRTRRVFERAWKEGDLRACLLAEAMLIKLLGLERLAEGEKDGGKVSVLIGSARG